MTATIARNSKRVFRRKTKNHVLRQHQNDALKVIKKVLKKCEGRGKILLPTGTGKTRIEAESICEMIQNNGDWGGIHVVLSPRILLSYQHLDEFINIVGNNGIDCRYMAVHSGGLNSVKYEHKLLKLGFKPMEDIDSSTTINSITSNMLSAIKEKKPLIIFSTYHSVERIDSAARTLHVPITSYVFDEAQYCVTSGKFKNVPNFPSSYKFFFTATEKTTNANDGLGMNNEGKFGKVLFTETPKTLIERGEMASIAMHLVGSRDQEIDEDDYESMATSVLEAFTKHRSVMKSHSFSPDLIGAKMIVVCNKQDALKGIMKSKALKAYKLENQKVNLCALSSDFGIEVNGVSTPRANNKTKEYLMSNMRNWSPESEAIILHVDMISEGIDVPGITAVMPFRGLGKIKFLQNIGRGTRLVTPDRERLYSGEIQAKAWKNYVKPFCWLILPVLSTDFYDQKRRYTAWVQSLRSQYGFSSNEMVIIDDIKAPPEKEKSDDKDGGNKPNFTTGEGLIKEIIHSIEDGEAMTEWMDKTFKFKSFKEEIQISLLRKIYS